MVTWLVQCIASMPPMLKGLIKGIKDVAPSFKADIKLCLRLTVYSLALWMLYTLVMYLMLLAMDLTGLDIPSIAKDPLAASLVLLVITTIGFVTPSAPGAVGTYHGVTVLGLSLFGVPGDRAAGFAILLHAMNFLPLTGIGLFFFWQQGLSFRTPAETD